MFYQRVYEIQKLLMALSPVVAKTQNLKSLLVPPSSLLHTRELLVCGLCNVHHHHNGTRKCLALTDLDLDCYSISLNPRLRHPPP